MITPALVEWQKLDEDSGIVFPWLTHPFLDEVKTWDLHNKVLLETGAGLSTAWWRSRAKWVDTIEASSIWALRALDYCQSHNLENGKIFCEQIADGIPGEMLKYFSLIPTDKQYDIIIIDGIYRTEMVAWGINHLEKNKGGILIADNFNQDYVWISPKAEELLSEFKINKYIQPGHINHEGRPWNTCWWQIYKNG